MTADRCARCDFRATDDDAAEAHARESGHMRCVVCRRQSLTVLQPQTCAGCVARVRRDLADLVEAYALLEPRGLPGLTLLGDGTMQRRAHSYELASLGVQPHPLDHEGTGRPKPIRDEWPSDPLPVVAALASWEDFWRADFGDSVGGPVTLSGVVGYLSRNLDTGHRAAQAHPAFDEFAADVGKLRADVRLTVGMADVPVEAEAECFNCGGRLLRTYEPPIVPVQIPRVGLPGEGLTTDLTCEWCRWVYTPGSYMLALRSATALWVPIPAAAKVTRRSVRTVRSWAIRLKVASRCRLSDRMIEVWWPDVSDRAFRHLDGEREEAS